MHPTPTHLVFLVSGTAPDVKYWYGEAEGDTTRTTTAKWGGVAKSEVKQHAEAAKARAFIDAEAAKLGKKGFAPLAPDHDATIPVLVVARGVHVHEGARVLLQDKELRCGFCGSDVEAVEVSARRLPLALLPTLVFPTAGAGDLGPNLKRAVKLAEVLAPLQAGSVWESRSLLAAKPKPVKKALALEAGEAARLAQRTIAPATMTAVFQRLLERTARGEPQVASRGQSTECSRPGRLSPASRHSSWAAASTMSTFTTAPG